MQRSDFRVGLVGVGRMGANIARHLLDEGYAIMAVFDTALEHAAKVAKELGCEAASSPARVAELSNVVITVVNDDAAMRRIFLEGWDCSLTVHADGRTFINCATLSPRLHHEIEALVERHGGRTLEACMASSITQARDGTLYLMCGGKRDVFEGVKPLLETMSADLRYIGKTGDAAKVKALVNMVMVTNTAALAEGLGLGDALGLDLTLLREVFAQTGAASRVVETDGEDMQNREHECYFSAFHATKDTGIALDLAAEVDLDLPLARATFAQYRRLISLGKHQLDKSAIAELTFKGRAT